MRDLKHGNRIGYEYITVSVIRLNDRAALIERDEEQKWVALSLIEGGSLKIEDGVTIGIEQWKLEELDW